MRLCKKYREEAKTLVKYANPLSRTKPADERVLTILKKKIPHGFGEQVIIEHFDVVEFSRNRLIKCARFNVYLDNGKVWEITAYERLVGRTLEEREEDKTRTFPSDFFNTFYTDITDKIKKGTAA
jgi:hypothetical protein